MCLKYLSRTTPTDEQFLNLARPPSHRAQGQNKPRGQTPRSDVHPKSGKSRIFLLQIIVQSSYVDPTCCNAHSNKLAYCSRTYSYTPGETFLNMQGLPTAIWWTNQQICWFCPNRPNGPRAPICLKAGFPVLTLIPTNRSEGFARTAYFVPGRDGIGVWPNSEIVPASSASSVANTSKTPKSQRTKKSPLGLRTEIRI